jgi:hypothetical protein
LHTVVVNREKFPNFSSSFNIGEMNPQGISRLLENKIIKT